MAAALVAAAVAGGCRTAEDCSLNGECGAEGVCACDPGWQGSACSALRLAGDGVGGYQAPNGTSSWGMSVARDTADGRWHGFVSEFAHGCKAGAGVGGGVRVRR